MFPAHVCAVFDTIIRMRIAYTHVLAHLPRAWRGLLAGSVLVLLAAAVFAPVFSARLLLWDDATFITHNYRIHQLSWHLVADLFRLRPHLGPHAFGLYVPLTELSAAVEYHFAGTDPRVYHTTNLVLHIFTVLLVWRLMCALELPPLAAWLAAMAFAVHPLQVESVAWVAERKNVLCGVFFTLALLLHVAWRRTARSSAYLGCIFTGMCALLSKPAAVTLPLALLAYDVWYQRRPFRPAVCAQLPLLACAAAAGMASLYLQCTHGAVSHVSLRSIIENIGIASRGVWWYICKFLLPVHLAPVYPRGEVTPLIAFWLIGACALVATIVWARRRAPLLSLGLAWYVIIGLPTLQLVPTGVNILTADRFFYLPGIGVLCASAAIWQRWFLRSTHYMPVNAAVAVLATWALAAHAYARVWHDDLRLWAYALRLQPQLLLAQKHYAVALHQAGRTNEAVCALRSVTHRQHDHRVFTLLAETEYACGNLTHALFWARAAVDAAPRAPEPRFVRAVIFSALGRAASATADWYAVLARQPLHPDVHHRLAYDLLALGDTNAALAAFQAHLARHGAALHFSPATNTLP